MKLRNLVAICLVLVCNIADAQLYAPNIDFETGTLSNWEYYTGTCCPIVTPRGTAPVTGMHTLTSGSGVDPVGGFPIVSPTGGNHSLLLNNSATTASKARYYVHVPTGGNYSLLYHYAVVLDGSVHSPAMDPRMEISAFDSATGAVVPCTPFSYVSTSTVPGFIHGSRGDYMPWKMGTFNFSGYGGRTIGIDFAASGCGYGGHSGYGYVDMSTGFFANKILLCAGASTVALIGPAGYASYRWCDSATFGITYDTTQNTTVAAPSGIVAYALICTPYPGYGCPDTLYTQVVPPCSGAPIAGYATYTRAPVCGLPDILSLSGYISACGNSYQWQSSPDSITWTNIAGASSSTYNFYTPTTGTYYRCVVACSYTGMSASSYHVYVPGLVITLTSNIVPDPLCGGTHFYGSSCGPSAYYNVTTYFGDGSSYNIPLAATRPNDTDFIHNYAYPGTYTIKQVLYDGTLPIDSLIRSYDEVQCSILPISLFNDHDSDCIFNSWDTYLYSPCQIQVDSNGVTIDTVSVTSGIHYLTYGGPGTIYSFKIISRSTWLSLICPTTGIIYDTILSSTTRYPTKFFGLKRNPGSFDLAEHAVIPVTGRRDQWGNIFVNDIAATSSTFGMLTMDFSPKWVFDLRRATPPISSIIGNTVTWYIGALTDRPISVYYVLWDNPATGMLTIGDTVHTRIRFTPFIGDYDTSNNHEIIIDTVRAGCDPNFIQVSPAGCLASGSIQNTLKYTVHFENTGNDTAHNIYIMDTLSNDIDLRTLEIVTASHRMNIATMDVAGYNVIKFDFPGIKLLDSSHHGFCDGMVMYNIKTKAGLPLGANITNRAGIYFDINPVVMTNEVNNVIGCPMYSLDIAETTGNKMQLYPNPAKDELIVKMSSTMNGTLEVTNQVGQVLMKQTVNSTQAKVNIKTLPAGLYFITMKDGNGSTVQKFVKM